MANAGSNNEYIGALRKGYKIDDPVVFDLGSLGPYPNTTLNGTTIATGTGTAVTATVTATGIVTTSVASSEGSVSGLPSSSPISIQSSTNSNPNPSSDLSVGTKIGLGVGCGTAFLILITMLILLIVRLRSRTKTLASLERQLNHRPDGPILESPDMKGSDPYGGELDDQKYNGPEPDGSSGQELATGFNGRKVSYPELKTYVSELKGDGYPAQHAR